MSKIHSLCSKKSICLAPELHNKTTAKHYSSDAYVIIIILSWSQRAQSGKNLLIRQCKLGVMLRNVILRSFLLFDFLNFPSKIVYMLHTRIVFKNNFSSNPIFPTINHSLCVP